MHVSTAIEAALVLNLTDLSLASLGGAISLFCSCCLIWSEQTFFHVSLHLTASVGTCIKILVHQRVYSFFMWSCYHTIPQCQDSEQLMKDSMELAEDR